LFGLICLVTFLNSKKWLQKKIKFVHLTHKTQHVTHLLLRVSDVTLTFPVVSLYFLCWDPVWSCTFGSNSWLLSTWTARSDVLLGSRPPIKNRLEHSIFLHIIDSFLTQNWTSKFLHGTICYKLPMLHSWKNNDHSPKYIFNKHAELL